MVKRTVETQTPRKTSLKEVATRTEEVVPKIDNAQINTMAILADRYPKSGEDYAIQLFYKTYRNPHIKVTEKSLSDDRETAYLTINDKKYSVNIRTGKIQTI